MKELTEKQTGLKLKTIKDFEPGKTYFCGYWSKVFEVLEVKQHDIWGKVYVCKWQDGTINTHSTAPTKNDFEVIEGGF
jgi:hypothetical protein